MTVNIKLSGHAIDFLAEPPHHWLRNDLELAITAHMDRLDWRFVVHDEVPDALFASRTARIEGFKAVKRQLLRNPEGLFDYVALFNVLFRGQVLNDQDPVDYLGMSFKRGQPVFNPERMSTKRVSDRMMRRPVSSIEIPARRIKF